MVSNIHLSPQKIVHLRSRFIQKSDGFSASITPMALHSSLALTTIPFFLGMTTPFGVKPFGAPFFRTNAAGASSSAWPSYPKYVAPPGRAIGQRPWGPLGHGIGPLRWTEEQPPSPQILQKLNSTGEADISSAYTKIKIGA